MTFDFEGARKAGASDDQIIEHLSSHPDYSGFDFASAKKAGAPSKEMIEYLKTEYKPREGKEKKKRSEDPHKWTSSDIPGTAKEVKRGVPSLLEKGIGGVEGALSTASSLASFVPSIPLAIVNKGLKMASGIPSKSLEDEIVDMQGQGTYSPRTEHGKDVAESVSKVMEESKIPLTEFPGMGKLHSTRLPKLGKVSEAIKPISETRIKPDEGVAEVLQRKRDARKAAAASKAEELNLPKQEVSVVDKDIGPLAKTDKDNNISLNHDKIEQDHKEGFKYIFDDASPTGEQKKVVFDHMNISKEEMKSRIPDVDTYKRFLTYHEQSHVYNNDRTTYPRTPEGKVDLMHPDAIAIETRATQDAFDMLEMEKEPHSPEESLHQEVVKEVVDEDKDHSTMKAAEDRIDSYKGEDKTEVVKDTLRSIRESDYKAEVYGHQLEKRVPDVNVRDRVTRSLEGQREYDRLFTDLEKKENLYGTGEKVPGKSYINRGRVGALQKMRENISADKIPVGKTREEYVLQADRLEASITKWQKTASEEHAIPILEEIKQRYADIGKKAVEAGVLDSLRENYVPHVLDFSKTKMTPEAQAAFLDNLFKAKKDSKLNRDFAEHRHYEFLRELENAVADTGIVVLTDIAKLLPIYEKSMGTAIAHKKMIDHFSRELSPNDHPWIMKVSEEANSLGYKQFQGKGAKPLEGWLIHPDLAPEMGHLFRSQDAGTITRIAGAITHLTKALNTVGSAFHAYSLGQAMFTSAPIRMVQAVFTEKDGVRAMSNLFKQGDTSGFTEAAIKGGLMIGTEDIKPTIIADTGKFADKMLSRLGPEVELVQKATGPLDKHVLQHLNMFTWDYMHTGGKLLLHTHFFNEIKGKHPELPDAQIHKEVASFVNNTLGGLDWLEVASQTQNGFVRALATKATSLRGREMGQILLFAPDWTVSTLRAVTTALPKELSKPQNWKLREGIKQVYSPKTQGDLARRYVFHTVVGWLTILNGINMAFSGHPIWDNEDPTRIELKDGRTMQLAKHGMEAAEWAKSPMKTLGNKLGFIPKAIASGLGGLEYPSPQSPKLKDTSVVGRAKAVAKLALPFQVSAGVGAPSGEGVSRAVASSLGTPIYGHKRDSAKSEEERRDSHIHRKEQRIKRLKNRMEKAK